MTVDKNTTIGEILRHAPETAQVFYDLGMHCLGCPHSAGESIESAAVVHGADVDELIAKINACIEDSGKESE